MKVPVLRGRNRHLQAAGTEHFTFSPSLQGRSGRLGARSRTLAEGLAPGVANSATSGVFRRAQPLDLVELNPCTAPTAAPPPRASWTPGSPSPATPFAGAASARDAASASPRTSA